MTILDVGEQGGLRFVDPFHDVGLGFHQRFRKRNFLHGWFQQARGLGAGLGEALRKRLDALLQVKIDVR